MDISTGIIAGVGAVVGLTGGGIALWVLQKPKVSLVSVKDLAWYRVYQDGVQLVGVQMCMTLILRNDGSEATTIDCVLYAVIAGQRTQTKSEEVIPLEGKGTRREVPVTFFVPKEKGCPSDAELVDASLALQPWGNKRLVCGKRTLEEKVTIPQVERFGIRRSLNR
jgi:hypothetical protein